MSLPTSIAFSENGNWANSPSVYYANHNGGAALLVALCGSSDMAVCIGRIKPHFSQNEDTSIKKIKGLLNDRPRKCLGFTLQMKSIMN
jgi:hypothetical protein